MFRAGDVEGTLTLDRTPFNRGLDMARADAGRFAREKFTATVDLDTGKASLDADRLQGKLDSLDTTANVDLDISAAMAKAELLKREVASIGGAGGVGGIGGTGGGGGSSVFGSGGFFQGSFLAKAAGAGALFAPTIGASALQGVLGAGALGLGAGAAAGVGGAGILGAAKPAVTALGNVTTAQKNLNTAIATYGKDSAQAKTATLALSAAQAALPDSGQKVARSLADIQTRWAHLSMPAQNQFFGLLSDGLHAAEQQLPMFAHSAETSMGAARGAMDHFFAVLKTPDFHTFVQTMTQTFAQGIGPFERGIENIGHVLERIAVASAPDVLRMLQGFQDVTHGWEQSTQNAASLQHNVHQTVEQFGEWFHLASALGHVLSALFLTNTRGAREGGHAIQGMADGLNNWANWIDHHHHEVNQFFINVLHTVEILGSALGNFAQTMEPLSVAIVPVSAAIRDTLNALNSVKVGNISALTALMVAWSATRFGGGLGGAAGGAAEAGGVGALLARLGGGSRLAGGGAVAAAGTAVLGGIATGKDIAGGSVGHAVGDIGLHLALGPGSFVARGLRQLPLLGGAIGGVEDKVSGLAHQVPVLGGAFDDLFGSGGSVAQAKKTISTFADGVHGGNRAVLSMQKQIDGLSTKSASDAINSLKDHYGSLVNAGHHMSAQQRKVWEDIAIQARDSGDITQTQLQQLTRAFSNNSQRWQAQMEAAAKVTGQSTHSIANSVGDSAVHVSKTYDGMVHVVGGGLNWLTSNTSRAAQAMGVKQSIQFHADPQAMHGPVGTRAGLALGGFVPGYSPIDNYQIGVRGGEAVLRPEDHVPIVSSALQHTYGFGLGDLFNRTGASSSLGFAKGGAVNFDGHPTNVVPAVRSAIGLMEQHFPGLAVTATTDGTHVAGSYHYQGKAVDMASSDYGYMDKAAAWVKSSGLYKSLLEGIHNPNLAVSNGQIFSGAGPFGAVWAEHLNHIHLALDSLGKVAGGVAAVQRLKRLILHPHNNMEGRVGQGALDKVWHAANHWLSQHSQAASALTGIGERGAPIKGLPASLQKYNRQYPDSGVSGGATMPFNKIAELAEWVGRGRIPGVTMAQVTKGESAMAPGAHGHDPGGTEGYGLWQITTGFNDALIKRLGGTGAMLNPVINAEAMASIYGGQGLRAWYGTSFVTDPNAHYTGPMKHGGGMIPPFGSAKVHPPEILVPGGQHGVGVVSQEDTMRVLRRAAQGGGHSGSGGGGFDVDVHIHGDVISDRPDPVEVVIRSRRAHQWAADVANEEIDGYDSHAKQLDRMMR
jgi:hypothetical protein